MTDILAMIARCMAHQLTDGATVLTSAEQQQVRGLGDMAVPGNAPYLAPAPSDQGIEGAIPITCEDVECP